MVSEYLGAQPFPFLCRRVFRHHIFIFCPFPFPSPIHGQTLAPPTQSSPRQACRVFSASSPVTVVDLVLRQMGAARWQISPSTAPRWQIQSGHAIDQGLRHQQGHRPSVADPVGSGTPSTEADRREGRGGCREGNAATANLHRGLPKRTPSHGRTPYDDVIPDLRHGELPSVTGLRADGFL